MPHSPQFTPRPSLFLSQAHKKKQKAAHVEQYWLQPNLFPNMLARMETGEGGGGGMTSRGSWMAES